MADEVTLYEHEGELGREEAARRLRAIADELESGNGVRVSRDGKTLTVKVPDRVEMSVELEGDGDGMELEIELSWKATGG